MQGVESCVQGISYEKGTNEIAAHAVCLRPIQCKYESASGWLVHLVTYFTCDLSLWAVVTSTSGLKIGTR
jgi:hypothetical protein